jgi:hypothetical protein
MRSAERGPTPGSFPRAAINDCNASGSAATGLHQAGNAQALRDAAHFLVGNFLCLAERIIGRSDDHFFQNLRVVRIEGGGIDFDRGDGSVAFGDDFDGAAAAGGFDGFGGKIGLNVLHLFLDALGLLHQFSNARHISFRATLPLSPHFYNRPLENLERLLDQRIVLEIFLREFRSCRRRLRTASRGW